MKDIHSVYSLTNTATALGYSQYEDKLAGTESQSINRSAASVDVSTMAVSNRILHYSAEYK